MDNFNGELERFAARWHQLKPKEEALEGGNQTKIEAGIKIVKEKRKEWDILMETRDALQSVIFDFHTLSFPFRYLNIAFRKV